MNVAPDKIMHFLGGAAIAAMVALGATWAGLSPVSSVLLACGCCRAGRGRQGGAGCAGVWPGRVCRFCLDRGRGDPGRGAVAGDGVRCAMAQPDFSTMTRAELSVWKIAIDASLAAAKVAGGADFNVVFLADDEGVSVTFTIPLPPSQS